MFSPLNLCVGYLVFFFRFFFFDKMYIVKKSIPQKYFSNIIKSPFLYVQSLPNRYFSLILTFKFDAILFIVLSEIVMTDCGDFNFLNSPKFRVQKRSFVIWRLSTETFENSNFSVGFSSFLRMKLLKFVFFPHSQSPPLHIYFVYPVGIILKEANCEYFVLIVDRVMKWTECHTIKHCPRDSPRMRDFKFTKNKNDERAERVESLRFRKVKMEKGIEL